MGRGSQVSRSIATGVLTVCVLGLFASVTTVLMSCSSRFAEARDRCSELSNKLYEARKTGQSDHVRTVLDSRLFTTHERDKLLATIVERDATCGHQQSREESLRFAFLESSTSDHWYSVRNGYRIEYTSGQTWEEILCRVDDSGRTLLAVKQFPGDFELCIAWGANRCTNSP
jgi:hypothetical protein